MEEKSLLELVPFSDEILRAEVEAEKARKYAKDTIAMVQSECEHKLVGQAPWSSLRRRVCLNCGLFSEGYSASKIDVGIVYSITDDDYYKRRRFNDR